MYIIYDQGKGMQSKLIIVFFPPVHTRRDDVIRDVVFFFFILNGLGSCPKIKGTQVDILRVRRGEGPEPRGLKKWSASSRPARLETRVSSLKSAVSIDRPVISVRWTDDGERVDEGGSGA
jgi:hypothetical protein